MRVVPVVQDDDGCHNCMNQIIRWSVFALIEAWLKIP